MTNSRDRSSGSSAIHSLCNRWEARLNRVKCPSVWFAKCIGADFQTATVSTHFSLKLTYPQKTTCTSSTVKIEALWVLLFKLQFHVKSICFPGMSPMEYIDKSAGSGVRCVCSCCVASTMFIADLSTCISTLSEEKTVPSTTAMLSIQNEPRTTDRKLACQDLA